MNYPEFWEAYATGAWEPETREWVDSVVRPGGIFVDVGAWIGPVSLWALERGAYVIAVEPDPVACEELARVLATAMDDQLAELWQVAVVATPLEEGTVMLAPNPKAGGEPGDSMSVIAPELDTSIPVPARTLWSILGDRIPDVVKIDVEGYETRLAPLLLPQLAEMGAKVQVSIHGEEISTEPFTRSRFLPDPRWGDWQLS